MKTPISYYGGKQQLSRLILRLIPPHRLYCEPFFGGGAVFFAKPRAEVEVINDLNEQVVNFYQVAKQDFGLLRMLVVSTPVSRALHRRAEYILKHAGEFSRIRRAWAFWVQTNMGFGNVMFRGYGYAKGKNSSVTKMVNKKAAFTKAIMQRLELTDIECNDALKVIASRDGVDTFFYIDPPYLGADQGHYEGYTETDFVQLLTLLEGVKGKFLLSCYPGPALDEFTRRNGWTSYHKNMALSMSKGKCKTECLTGNYDFLPIIPEGV